MPYLIVLLHVLQAIGHGYTCWPELHPEGWVEWICQKP